tara:strand:- start:5713 stop:5943 length:231 start_codon:yes stop_codon:yes gene_type:complete
MENSSRNAILISSVLLVGGVIYWLIGRKKDKIASGEIKLGGKTIKLTKSQMKKIEEEGYSKKELKEMMDKGVGVFG